MGGSPTTVADTTPSSSGGQPVLLFVQGTDEIRIPIERLPFEIGRKTDKDLVIPDPRVSRDHARITREGDDYYLLDLGSKHGTFVNGQKIERHQLKRNDRMDFGAGDRLYVVFHPESGPSAAREFLSQISVIQMPGGAASDLEKLKLFLEAARKLNTSGVVDDVLVTLVDTTLRLTHAERGFVFLRDKEGTLRMAVGRNSRGDTISDDSTISHSTLQDAANSASEFMITDTSKEAGLASRNSIVAYDLRTVICIPLRRMQVQEKKADPGQTTSSTIDVIGVLYLDSRFASREITAVSNDILRAISTEAAALVENAGLVQAEAVARLYQQELAIAASIQQRLLTVHIPDVPFAEVRARNLACKDIGGDFFDAVRTADTLAVIVADVSGKGVSAAILGSILQGMLYSQLDAGLNSLVDIVTAANHYLCSRVMGEKYATLIMVRLWPDGTLEFVNCGHVPPVLVSGGKVTRPAECSLPVGLLSVAQYEGAKLKLKPGDRLVLVTDGVTEAEDASGEFFGNERLEQAAACDNPFENVFEEVKRFCASMALTDDCTVLELIYKGPPA